MMKRQLVRRLSLEQLERREVLSLNIRCFVNSDGINCAAREPVYNSEDCYRNPF